VPLQPSQFGGDNEQLLTGETPMKTCYLFFFGLCLTLSGIVFTGKAAAATYDVNSIAALQAQINGALPGDVIRVAEGIYTTNTAVTINRQGTATAPIKIVAASVGGVEITGAQGFNVTSPAAYIVIEGFRLRHASGRNQIRSGATHIRFTQNIFECTGDGAYLTVAGHDAEVDGNEFRNKSTVGNMIDVRGSGSQVAQRVWIHHNYFHDFVSPGENGAETIRFGLSGLSLSQGFGLIEHNLFVRATGENEMLSIKSGSNTIRYNTLIESPGAQITLRHGNENLVYGNYLRGTDGIRIFGDRHQVFSNYLEANSGGINIGNGDGEVADGAPLTSHDRPDNCVISFNTLVNNERNYYMTGRTNGLGATNTVFVNNIVQGGGAAASLNGPYTGGIWGGNIIWLTGGSGPMPAGTYDEVDPLLAPDSVGVYRPQRGSPAIDTATGDYPVVSDKPVVMFDMDGERRTDPKDKGADEVSFKTVANCRIGFDPFP
jgi:Chondroitinase B